MSWLYDDQDLSHQPDATAADSAAIHPTDDFELFHEQVAPIDVGPADLAPVASDQGIKHVRVRNLQWWTNENAFRQLLTDCGVIKSIEFEASMKNGKSLGIANIEFDTSDAALRAIDQIDNREIDGRVVNANLLMVEDVKITSSQSQRQHHGHSGRKLISPRRSIRPAGGSTGPGSRELPPADSLRQQRIPTREGSLAKTGKSGDHHRHDGDKISTPRDPDWGRTPPAPTPPSSAPFHPPNPEPTSTHSERDTIRLRSSSSSIPDQPTRRREPEIHRDRERLIHGDRVSQRPSSRADPHPINDVDLSRRSSYSNARHSDIRHSDIRHSDIRHSDVRHSDVRHSDVRHSSHSRRGEIERSSRDLKSDHERSRHRSHRDLDDERLARRMHEYDKGHASLSFERHASRYRERSEPDDRYPSSHHTSDHRSRKRRR